MNPERKRIERYRKALLASIKRFAKDIQQKFLPPATTNFGNSLPIEGLYSEVVRNPEFFDRRCRRTNFSGWASTLSAPSLVCFKTLNIQKSVDDISKEVGIGQIRI